MTTRRAFLKSSACAAMGSLRFADRDRVFGKTSNTLDKIGLQLYTVRSEMQEDFDLTLARVAAIGYREVEFAGYFNHPPGKVKSALHRFGLDGISSHVPIAVLRRDWEKTIEMAKTIGHQYLICPWLSPDERKTLDDYKKLSELFNRSGEMSQRSGIQFGYHNHDFEFQPIDGKLPYDVLLAETDPQLVKMELDLYWITKGGQDPIAYLQKYPGRFSLCHVKDMDDTPKQPFTEVGRGVIDFKTILAQARASGVKHYFVEHDEPSGSPFDSIKISFDYLKQLEF